MGAKSARFSGPASDFEFVFPVHTKPVDNENDARLKALLLRLGHAYSLSPANADL